MKQLGFFIALSLLLHFLLTTSTLYFAQRILLEDLSKRPVELEVLSPESDLQERLNQTRQLVKQLKTTVQQLKDTKIKARFESEQTQRVEKETKASQLGLSANKNSAQPKMQILPQNHLAQTVENKTKLAKNDGDLPEFARAKNPATAQVAISEQSAISQALPNDIQSSNSTNLNTDANTYYSFYSRVEELFYVRWVERTNYYWNRISYEYKKNTLAGKTWVTDLEVWLTATGEFHSAYVKRSSGYQPFDEAAVYAFKNARLFPNPPKAKVEADGFVRLRYRFNINVAATQ